MTTLTLSGKDIHSLDDIYAIVTQVYHLDATLFGRNLDALYDILSDQKMTKILIRENTLLKESLQKIHKNGMTEYMTLLDLLTDLELPIVIE